MLANTGTVLSRQRRHMKKLLFDNDYGLFGPGNELVRDSVWLD